MSCSKWRWSFDCDKYPCPGDCDVCTKEWSLTFTIALAPVTKKNSQRLIKQGDRIIPIPSAKYQEYERGASYLLGKYRGMMIDHPVNIKCLFYMPTRRRVDLTNLLEAIDDVLVTNKVLADDNCNILVSHDGSRVLYDKEHPRTEIVITDA